MVCQNVFLPDLFSPPPGRNGPKYSFFWTRNILLWLRIGTELKLITTKILGAHQRVVNSSKAKKLIILGKVVDVL